MYIANVVHILILYALLSLAPLVYTAHPAQHVHIVCRLLVATVRCNRHYQHITTQTLHTIIVSIVQACTLYVACKHESDFSWLTLQGSHAGS